MFRFYSLIFRGVDVLHQSGEISMVIWVKYKGKKSKRLTGGTKLQSSGQDRTSIMLLNRIRSSKLAPALDAWMSGYLDACHPGHLHAHHFFIQTAAAPSLERKLAVAVDPQSQRAGEWNFPNRWGDLGIR